MKLSGKLKTLADYLVAPPPVAMKASLRLDVDTRTLRRLDPGYGDFLVHPCVRYIPEGLGGHKWWMVVTPYPRTDVRYENPVLYHGEGNENVPPVRWAFSGIVQDAYPTGYNADGNLFFDGKKLWIIWKEDGTPDTTASSGHNRIMGRSFDGQAFGPVRKFCDNPDTQVNRITAPTLLNVNGAVKCLATRYNGRTDDPVLPHGKSGLAVWRLEGKDLDSGRFVFERDADPDYPAGFDFWHADFFEEKGRYYGVVTPENATRILFGESEDGFSYRFGPKPVCSSGGNLYLGMYKASAVVVDGRIHVFFPRRSLTGRKSRLYCASMGFDAFRRTLSL